jgi:superfamily II DNA or RNA helicase
MKKRVAPKLITFAITPEYKEIVRTQAYLGRKGYTIPKSALKEQDLEVVKKELCMIPFTMGPKTASSAPVSFPVYRENSAKIYIPRFYGVGRYGLPDKSELALGDDIDVPFVKELRDYQNKIIGVYLDYVRPTKGGEEGGHKGNGAILEVPCGKGKCLAKGTPVMMYDRSIKLVEDIVVGDVLLGDDLSPRNVLTLNRGEEVMYKVKEKGSNRSYTVNKSHILTLFNIWDSKLYDISVEEYLGLLNKGKYRGVRILNEEFPLIYEIELEELAVGEYYGFEIDGNRRFVLGDYSITHNTVMALNIISQIKKKTLILVHKEFLMNQWIERIEEFMPAARVGKIQGPTFDVDDKDIVIGMIQTMHSRDFPTSAFDSFGMTVIDEVHRIGSEEFSKTLFKVVTPYMLGISATVERKDRLTKILYMFIGNKIYSEDRTDDDVVQVRGITFKTRDSEFNHTEYDFRGNPKYSTMITKLCQFGPRSDFIVRVIADLIEENPHKQIMVLAHNRELLTFMFDAIRHKISSEENMVGYYVGGMKEKDLKITEGCRIVLATYAMAAEALDIKTLSTLVMATPKTDVEQSVGRILRAKGQNPIVVDILDTHDYLRRQWNTRKTFYRKCMYRIVSTDTDAYTGFGNVDKWKVEFDPAAVKQANEERKCLITIPKEDLEVE